VGHPHPRSAGKAVGGGTDAIEESVGAIQRQRAVQQGLEDTVERAQDGVAIGERAETDGWAPVPHQRPLAAPFTQVEVPVIVTAVLAGGDERTTRVSIGLDGRAKFMFHRFSSIIKKT
jgi:hypothetical protein